MVFCFVGGKWLFGRASGECACLRAGLDYLLRVTVCKPSFPVLQKSASICSDCTLRLIKAHSSLSSSIIKILFMAQFLSLFCPTINRLLRSFWEKPNTSHFHSAGDTPSGAIIIYPTRCYAPFLGGLFQCHIVHFAPP